MSTPSLSLRASNRGRIRRERRRLASPAALDRLALRIIAAVNRRGLCAVELARLAELPEPEVSRIGRDCDCPSCFSDRAN
jgi:hypothetical protein